MPVDLGSITTGCVNRADFTLACWGTPTSLIIAELLSLSRLCDGLPTIISQAFCNALPSKVTGADAGVGSVVRHRNSTAPKGEGTAGQCRRDRPPSLAAGSAGLLE